MLLLLTVQSNKAMENCITVGQKQCRFPFEYNNKMYTGCTDRNNPGKYWCRTTCSSEDWGYCEAKCTTNEGETIGDTECREGEICMGKDSCPVYTNYVEHSKFWEKDRRDSEKKKLQEKICKKKPDRLCCKAQNLPTKHCTNLPNKDQCGLSLGTKNVVFGSKAVMGEFPWAALVGSEKVLKQFDNLRKTWSNKAYTLYHCGGTLINTWFVLTAAHCHTNATKIVTVVLGEWDVLTDPDCAGGDCDNPKVQKREVSEVIIHSGYNKSKNKNDIALIKMTREVMLNRFVKLACLPLQEYLLPNYFHNPELQNATVVGWGRKSNRNPSDYEDNIKRQYGVLTTRLQKGRIPIQPKAMCSNAYKQYAITTSQLCAGGGPGHTDSCRGDSGGGLFVHSGENPGQSQGNVHVLVGVVSTGSNLCGDSPSVYTKVDQFIPWIKRTIA